MGAALRERLVNAQPDRNDPASASPIEPSLQQAVDEAEADLARGQHVEHDAVMAKLRRWMDGA